MANFALKMDIFLLSFV